MLLLTPIVGSFRSYLHIVNMAFAQASTGYPDKLCFGLQIGQCSGTSIAHCSAKAASIASSRSQPWKLRAAGSLV